MTSLLNKLVESVVRANPPRVTPPKTTPISDIVYRFRTAIRILFARSRSIADDHFLSIYHTRRGLIKN